MSNLSTNTVRKFQLATRLLKQLTETDGGISPTLEGVWLTVGERALVYLNEGVSEAQQAYDAG